MHISTHHTILSSQFTAKTIADEQAKTPSELPLNSQKATSDSVDLSPEATAVSKSPAAPKAPNNPFATNILNAINGQLSADLADNATKEQLQSRLEAGFSGFMQGFSEAFAQLEGMAGFSPEIASEINETKRQVLEGLAAKGEELGLDITDLNKALKSLETETLESRKPDTAAATPTINAPTFNQHVAASQSRSFAFELVTQEGDKIQILLDSMQAGEIGRDGNSRSVSYASQDNFSLSIEGDLNADELKAINQLLGNVNQLSQDFYNGDLASAFDKAMTMGFDAGQIQQFSLQLSQTTEVSSSIGQKAQRAYQADLPQSEKGSPINALGQYLKQVSETYQSAQVFGINKETFVELSEFVTLSYREEASAYKNLLTEVLPQDM